MFQFTKRETAIFPRLSRRALAPMTALFLGLGLLPACNDGSLDPDKGGTAGAGEAGAAVAAPAAARARAARRI